MKVNTLWQIMTDRPDKIVIRIENRHAFQPTYRQEYLPHQPIPQFIWEETVQNWHLVNEMDGKKILIVDLWSK